MNFLASKSSFFWRRSKIRLVWYKFARKHHQQKKGDENVINTLICEIMFALQSSTFTGARVVSAKNATRRCVSFSLALNTLFARAQM